MVKRCAAILLVCILLCPALALSANTSVVNALQSPMVVDDAGLYTDSEKAEMERLITAMRGTYQMDVGVLTTNDVPSSYGNDSVSVDYADRYYEDHGYGMGEDRAGVLFVLDMNNRFNYLSTAGTMADYLNDHRIEEILSSADDALRIGAYGSAMLSQLSMLETFLRSGIEEGSFRYDAVTGERLTGIYNKLTKAELLMALAVGAVIALLLFKTVSATYSLRGGTYRYDPSGRKLDLKVNDSRFIREDVTRVRMPPPSAGGHSGGHSSGMGSSMHTSSGGMSHGGGGHHF